MPSKNFLDRLNALVNCDPSRCTKAGCPLYYETVGKCDAYRFISLFNSIMKEKLEAVTKYDPFDDN